MFCDYAVKPLKFSRLKSKRLAGKTNNLNKISNNFRDRYKKSRTGSLLGGFVDSYTSSERTSRKISRCSHKRLFLMPAITGGVSFICFWIFSSRLDSARRRFRSVVIVTGIQDWISAFRKIVRSGEWGAKIR
jgi:hypothetical protein